MKTVLKCIMQNLIWVCPTDIQRVRKRLKLEKVYREKFYLFVLYKDFIGKKRNKNKIIVNNFKKI